MVDRLKLATEAVALTGPQYDELLDSIRAFEDDLIEAGAVADETGMVLLRTIVDDVLQTVRTTRETLKVARFGLPYGIGATTFNGDFSSG